MWTVGDWDYIRVFVVTVLLEAPRSGLCQGGTCKGSVRGSAEGWMGVGWFRVEGGASEAVRRGG